jgi:hypothetical protein
VSAFTEGKASVLGELDQLRDRLRKLVHHFNQDEAWDAALRAQTALVAVDSIGFAQDTDFEAAYP